MRVWPVKERAAQDLEDAATSLLDDGVDAYRRVRDMGNVQKGLLGAGVGLVNLAILLLIWRWWLKRQPSTPTVVT